MAISKIVTNSVDSGVTFTLPVMNTITSAAATALTLQSAGNTAVTIDTSQNVGIGTSTPASWSTLAALGSNGTGFAGITAINSNANVGIGGIQFASDTTYTKAAIGLLRQNANGSGALVFYNDSNADAANWATTDEKMRIDSSGNLMVGTTSVIQSGKINQTGGSFSGTNAGAVFDGGRLSTNGDMAYFRSTTTLAGYITITSANTCTYNSVSDVRLKKNIVDAPSALAKVESLQVRSFDWKDETGVVPYGFIAQELNEIVPEAVSQGTTNEDGSMLTPWGIDTSLLVPYLTKAIQEQQSLILALTARLETLEAK